MFRAFFVFLLLLITINAFTQSPNPVSIGLNLHGGFLAYHHSNMRNYVQNHIKGMEIEAGFKLNGTKSWHRHYNFPIVGFSFLFLDLGNKELIGSGIGFSPFVKIPIIKKERSAFQFRVATGVGYVEKIFDGEINNKATAIGSHVNAFINLRLDYSLKVYKSIFVNTGLGLGHFSNGGSKAPNRGVNFPTIHLGLSYNAPTTSAKSDTSIYKYDKHRFFAIIAGGVSQLSRPNDKSHGAFTGSFFYDFRPTIKTSFGAGLDWMYNGVVLARMKSDSLQITNPLQAGRLGVRLHYQFNFHNIMFPVEFGTYLISAYKKDGPFYHRIGVRYLIKDHFVLNLTLKTHWAVAEYIEWGMGYRF